MDENIEDIYIKEYKEDGQFFWRRSREYRTMDKFNKDSKERKKIGIIREEGGRKGERTRWEKEKGREGESSLSNT